MERILRLALERADSSLLRYRSSPFGFFSSIFINSRSSLISIGSKAVLKSKAVGSKRYVELIQTLQPSLSYERNLVSDGRG